MQRLATQIAVSANMRGLYPAKHPRVILSLQQMNAALHEHLDEDRTDSVTYVLIGDDLLVGDAVIRKSTVSLQGFIALLKRRGVERLTLARGLEEEEAEKFVAALAAGDPLQSSGHIIVGRAHVAMVDEAAQQERRKLSVDQVEMARDAWARFRVERQLPIDQMEQLVWSLIDSLAGTSRAMLPLAPLREHDEYTFVHSVNVSLLVLLQARSFGIWGPMLHMFGMAALLHDIGKLSIPLSILNKPGKLDDAEWEILKGHARLGGLYLSEIEGISPLSPIVAYEHHLRYDGEANYPKMRSRRIPNLASRMTAIADAYDAMSTVRPYQEPLGRAAAFEVLKKRSGTFYDPTLVANFIRLIGEATPLAD